VAFGNNDLSVAILESKFDAAVPGVKAEELAAVPVVEAEVLADVPGVNAEVDAALTVANAAFLKVDVVVSELDDVRSTEADC